MSNAGVFFLETNVLYFNQDVSHGLGQHTIAVSKRICTLDIIKPKRGSFLSVYNSAEDETYSQ